MKESTMKRLARLEQAAGKGNKQLVIIRNIIDIDENGKPFICGGIRRTPGQPYEELPASFFDEEETMQ